MTSASALQYGPPQIRALPLSEHWEAPGFSAAFSNYELQFKPAGQPGPARIHRHIAANLDNAHFNRDSEVFRHLRRKGRVAALTKGALNALWDNDFSNIRDYLIDHADYVISDCSGISPLHALPAGFTYTTFGRYEGMLSLAAHQQHEQALTEQFARQPYRPLPARFGYADRRANANLLIMRRERQ
jgi:hypothetical protein